MKLISRTIIIFISIGFLWLAIALLFIRPNLSRIEADYLSVKTGASHAQVKSALATLRETRVELKDVPNGYREMIKSSECLKIYKYERVCSLFAFHVIYDENDRVQSKLPTYE